MGFQTVNIAANKGLRVFLLQSHHHLLRRNGRIRTGLQGNFPQSVITLNFVCTRCSRLAFPTISCDRRGDLRLRWLLLCRRRSRYGLPCWRIHQRLNTGFLERRWIQQQRIFTQRATRRPVQFNEKIQERFINRFTGAENDSIAFDLEFDFGQKIHTLDTSAFKVGRLGQCRLNFEVGQTFRIQQFDFRLQRLIQIGLKVQLT